MSWRDKLENFSEFARGVRISDQDVDNERGAVLEEWRSGRCERESGASVWEALFEGSLYADRSPIGTEDVIRNAPGSFFVTFTTSGTDRRIWRLSSLAILMTSAR